MLTILSTLISYTNSYSGNYGAIKNFCFDMLCHDDLLLDMNKTQLVERISIFANELKEQSDRSKGHNILLTMGGDFNVRIMYVDIMDL